MCTWLSVGNIMALAYHVKHGPGTRNNLYFYVWVLFLNFLSCSVEHEQLLSAYTSEPAHNEELLFSSQF